MVKIDLQHWYLVCQHGLHADQDPKALLDVSAEEDFDAKLAEADAGAAISALTILRSACIAPVCTRCQGMM